jgi:hypothetical protein
MVDIVQKVQIDVFPYDWIYINQTEDWGRVKVAITINPSVVDAVNWVKDYKKQLEDEIKIRSENPAVASQYECYQAMLKLVKSDHIP